VVPPAAGQHREVLPGHNPKFATTRLMSAIYKIWVRWRSTWVHSSAVGARRINQPLLGARAVTLLPNGWPIQS
jgi:hypothetical protein